ncbi:MAG TPA: 4Fe-4S dicluster domain-containing protein [Gemmatimonadales bacterium]|nr:4Fe-4S dicluster domain-containing protein [Gemmatimonadales bacterium]
MSDALLTSARPGAGVSARTPLWAKVIDHTRCIGCHACSTACKSENEVPLSVNRTYVKYVDVGEFPTVRRAFQVTRCNQCEHPPCVTACPTSAMYRRPDGIVDFDKAICIGCKACIAACPYDAIFINPDDHSAEKCNLCAHRLDMGLEPACVVVCPTEAILVGDLRDAGSRVATMVKREPVAVRRPEKETQPKLFYKGAHLATLDPLAARRPPGGLFLWGEQASGADAVTSGHPGPGNSSARAVLSYDVPHRMPWDWRVSLYTWTKSIAAGTYLVGLGLAKMGLIDPAGTVWRWVVPLLSATFLAVTGLLLIWDLEHPERCWLIFRRPQWKSWLVRGAVVITAYGAVLGGHLAASWIAADRLNQALPLLGLPLAVLTAVYTAYLFAQAKGRDLWQSALLPPHLLGQAVLAGSAALIPVAAALEAPAVQPLLFVLAAACVAHLGVVVGEITLTHATAHARLALHEMVRGRYAAWFWGGATLVAAAVAAPWLGVAAAPLALGGLLAYEHAYVQAGQAVGMA